MFFSLFKLVTRLEIAQFIVILNTGCGKNRLMDSAFTNGIKLRKKLLFFKLNALKIKIIYNIRIKNKTQDLI